MRSLLHDIRYAIRRLHSSRGFALVSIATIALAIGANTAMFSFVKGVLLAPLPYPDPDRIVRLLERPPAGGVNGVSTLNYLVWVHQQTVFEHMAAEAAWRPTWTGGDEPVVLDGVRVSAHYFDIFGVAPALGRTFRDGEDEPGSDRVVLLTHALWERRFGSDPAIVGRQLVLDGDAYVVVGVLPEGPFDRAAAQIWKPLAFEPANLTRDYRWLGVSAKLKAGITLERARGEMAVIAQRLATAYPDADKGWGVAVDRLGDVIVGPQLRTVITVLFAATVFVLLIGCANLANLGLARTISKQGEIAVRYALGAGRWRLTQQLLIEHLVMAACGGIAGIAVGYGLLKWIRRLIPPTVLPPAVDVRIDGSVLFFALTATVATGVLFGVAPAAHAARSRLAVSLGSRGQGGAASSPGRGVRGSLVIAEVALAFVLLVASGVLMRSFFKLLHVDPGFDATNVLTANLPLNQHDHPDPVELVAYLDSIRRAVESVPGVRRTALTSALPLEGWGYGVPYAVAGREPADEGNRRPVFFKIVSPSYFDALGIRLIAGRDLNENDRSGAPRVAVVNETLARREFPDGNAIGHRIVAPEPAAGRTGFGKPLEWEIVGVIADEKINGLGDEFSAGMYVSDVQSPTYTVNLVVKAGVAPESLQKGIRSAIDRVNRNQALAKVRTLAYIADQSRRGSQVVSTLLTVFSAMALLLAAVGIYGVISYMAAQRTQEIGIRAALGASRADLRYLIVRGGMRLALGGLAAGLIVMVPAMDVLSSLLFGVVTYDAPTIASVAVILFAVAGFASYLPAWRATRTDPVEALRHP